MIRCRLAVLLPLFVVLACEGDEPFAPASALPAGDELASRVIDLAAPPTRSRFVQDFGLAVPEDCGTFLAVPGGTQTVTLKDFGDRLTIQIVRQATWTNSVTGKSAKERSALNIIVDFETGRVVWNGNAGGMTIRGEGKVIQRSGRIVFDETGQMIFVAGPDRFEILENPPNLCDLLS